MIAVNSPNSSVRIHGGRTRHKVASTKRSLSGDDRKYIEHLEGELSAVQNELPSVTHEHAVKLHRITAENKQLQAQLKDWEIRYDEEVRDFVQQQNMVERSLRSKNTSLEDYASKAKDRVVELEMQLQRMQQALDGAEAANAQLEKRIEIMSELLTSSPAKLDFSSDAPGRRRMQSRPRSMLPRLPNNRGSWIGSPERTPDFGALTSPALTSAQPRDATPEAFEPLERIVYREVWSSSPNNASEGDDYRPPSARSATFSDHFARDQETQQNHARVRPTRRMRRFAPGSNGPKPLILPYASQVDQNSMSAFALDRHEAIPSLPFRRSSQHNTLGSPLETRPRASTLASESALGFNESPDSRYQDEAGFRRMLGLARAASDSRTSSFASAVSEADLVSRNLLNELHAVKLADASTVAGSVDDSQHNLEHPQRMSARSADMPQTHDVLALTSPVASQPQQWEAESMELSMIRREEAFNPALESIMGPFGQSSPDLDLTPKAVWQSDHASAALHTSDNSLSALDRLRNVFGDLLRSPADLARVIIHVTQQRMHIPEQLLHVQWWVVGLLWGPMAKRGMIQRSHADEARYLHRPELIRCHTPSLALNESLAYGTVYNSPPSSLRRRAGMAGPGKKRSDSAKRCGKENSSLLAKHNPLLWIKFSITLAFAVGKAFTSGPGSLLPGKQCSCQSCMTAEHES